MWNIEEMTYGSSMKKKVKNFTVVKVQGKGGLLILSEVFDNSLKV